MQSRRSFLTGLGSGIAAVAAVWALREYRPWQRAPHDVHPVPECCTYLDYAGWILTKVDKDRLNATGGLQKLEEH